MYYKPKHVQGQVQDFNPDYDKKKKASICVD